MPGPAGTHRKGSAPGHPDCAALACFDGECLLNLAEANDVLGEVGAAQIAALALGGSEGENPVMNAENRVFRGDTGVAFRP